MLINVNISFSLLFLLIINNKLASPASPRVLELVLTLFGIKATVEAGISF